MMRGDLVAVSGLIGHTVSGLPIYVADRPGVVLGVAHGRYRVELTKGPLPYTIVDGTQLRLIRGKNEHSNHTRLVRGSGGTAWDT
jgi:hypothetical protein